MLYRNGLPSHKQVKSNLISRVPSYQRRSPPLTINQNVTHCSSFYFSVTVRRWCGLQDENNSRIDIEFRKRVSRFAYRTGETRSLSLAMSSQELKSIQRFFRRYHNLICNCYCAVDWKFRVLRAVFMLFLRSILQFRTAARGLVDVKASGEMRLTEDFFTEKRCSSSLSTVGRKPLLTFSIWNNLFRKLITLPR